MRRTFAIVLAALVPCLFAAAALAQDPAPASGMTMPPSNNASWVLTPDLGPDATQVEYGAEVYRLVCKACHGDKGQGLTPDWIAQWAPEDQNCWQSKCHAANHPPDGFVLPRDIPPVVGDAVTNRFVSGSQLHSYIAATMPWHAPGRLTSDEYWQVTAYLVEQNGVKVGNATIGEENAGAYKLALAAQARDGTPIFAPTPQEPGAAATQQAELAAQNAAEEAAEEGWPWGWGALVLGSMAGTVWVLNTAVRQITE
jgi:cytochrome c1